MRFRDRFLRLLTRLWRTPAVRESENSASDDLDHDEVDGTANLFDPFPEPVRLEIEDIFDLHTIAPRDVARVVEEYLYEARRAGFRVVRIIHGKGVGVQREIVRSILARTPFVEEWADAPPEAGGWGATIARLALDDDRI